MDSSPIAELEASATLSPGPARKLPSIVYLAGALAGGNVLSSVLRMVGGILQARLVTVPMLGLFCILSLAMEYASMAQFGVFNGLNRELPYFSGKGDHRRVSELAAAAQAWAILVSLLVAVVMLALAIWYGIQGDMWRAAGWLSNALFASLLFYCAQPISYLQVTYRTGHDFARLAMVGVVQNAVGLVLIVLVAYFNFYGMCLRMLLTFAVSGVLLHYMRPLRVGPKWNTVHLKHLLAVGLPIFGVGLLYYGWTTLLNKTLVATYTGERGMGLYSNVITAATMLELLPGAVGQIVYPRMSEKYGRTGKLQGLLGMTAKPMALTALGMIPVIALCWWLVEPAMRLVLPRYIEAVPAMRWGMLVPFISSFAPVNLVFNVVRRMDLYLVAILLGMATYGGCLLWLLRGGVTLVAFPQAMLAGQVVFMLSSYAFVLYLTRRERAAS
jgi:hypothetical protein